MHPLVEAYPRDLVVRALVELAETGRVTVVGNPRIPADSDEEIDRVRSMTRDEARRTVAALERHVAR